MTVWKCSTNRIHWNNVTSDNKSPRWHIYTCIHAVIHTVTFAQYLPREGEVEREGGVECRSWAGEKWSECVSGSTVHPKAQWLLFFSQWWTDEHTNFEPDDSRQHPLFAFLSLQVFIGCCSVNESSGLNMSGVFSFKFVSTFPDSFLNLQCHIQMLARQREFVICHWCSLISVLAFSSYLLYLVWIKKTWRPAV